MKSGPDRRLEKIIHRFYGESRRQVSQKPRKKILVVMKLRLIVPHSEGVRNIRLDAPLLFLENQVIFGDLSRSNYIISTYQIKTQSLQIHE